MMGVVGFTSQFSVAGLVIASCCGETVCMFRNSTWI